MRRWARCDQPRWQRAATQPVSALVSGASAGHNLSFQEGLQEKQDTASPSTAGRDALRFDVICVCEQTGGPPALPPPPPPPPPPPSLGNSSLDLGAIADAGSRRLHKSNVNELLDAIQDKGTKVLVKQHAATVVEELDAGAGQGGLKKLNKMALLMQKKQRDHQKQTSALDQLRERQLEVSAWPPTPAVPLCLSSRSLSLPTAAQLRPPVSRRR
jgi:hypothetical protein